MKGMQKFVPQSMQKAAAAAQEAAEDLDIDLNDPDLSKAATKIQASFRGHKTRKEVKDVKDQVEDHVQEAKDHVVSNVKHAKDQVVTNVKDARDNVITNVKGGISNVANAAADAADEIADIDLKDPDLAKAATKIQASFRGYQTRRDHKPE